MDQMFKDRSLLEIKITSWGWAVPSSVQAGARFACFDWVQTR